MSISQTQRKRPYLIALLLLIAASVIALLLLYFIKGKPLETPLYPKETLQHAEMLQEQILSFDAHIDIPLEFGSSGQEANREGHGQFDLVKAGKGRLSGAALAIWAWPDMWVGSDGPRRPTAGFLEAAQHEQEVRYRIIKGIARDYPNQAGIAYTPEDFKRLAEQGKFAIVISMLNAYPLGTDISLLDKWAARGMRIFGFSYVANNAWADSSRPLPFYGDIRDELGGLSELGKQAIGRLNDLGVIIDVSQMSTHALTQATELTRAPVIASHSGVRGQVDIERNLSDQELLLIRKTGGVVHIPGFTSYIKPWSRETLQRVNQLRAEYGLPDVQNLSQASMPGDPIISVWPESRFGSYAGALYGILEEDPKATLKDYGDAIDYAVKKIGIDHVGISTDFNDGGGIVGWESVTDTRNVTAELIERGYSDQDIAKLWGGNFLRVWQEVQSKALPTPSPVQP